MKTTIYWVTKDVGNIQRIREKFNLSADTTLNGETPAEIREEDIPLLRETEKRGFIQIRNKNEV
ncbi:hypothetical protein [Bacteroides ihuae]|uniref:hypothetical protein n=1 Tax=Bacteroides ihuae TaxID=1852362 RepID=UPI0008D989FF|nr:hypothetical protein [Bacteroides ihuae]